MACTDSIASYATSSADSGKSDYSANLLASRSLTGGRQPLPGSPHPSTPELAPRHPCLLPTPRLTPAVSYGQHVPQALQTRSVSHGQDVLHLSSAPLSSALDDTISNASTSTPVPPRSEQQPQLEYQNLSHVDSHGTPASVSGPQDESPCACTVIFTSDAWLSSSSSSGASDTDSDSVADDSWDAVLVTNDLFQQLSEGSLEAVPQDHPGSGEVLLRQWQGNGIFDSQASLLDTTGPWTSAAPGLWHSAVLDSRQSMTELLQPQPQASETAEESHASESGCSPGAGDTAPLQLQCTADAPPNQCMASHRRASSEVGEGQQHQSGVYSDLFDTQLSQLLTTNEEALSFSAPQQALAVSGNIFTQSHTQDLQPAPFVFATGPGPESAAVPEVAPAAAFSNLSEVSCACDEAVDSPAAGRPWTTAATSMVDASQQAAVQGLNPHCKDPRQREPLVAAVSTARLEIMGWDMFADTLGTFCLLSESDSNVESTTMLLPELAPVTPECGLPEPSMTRYQPPANSPLDYDGRTRTGSPESCHSQDVAVFDISDAHMNKAGMCNDLYGGCLPSSTLEWEYHVRHEAERYFSIHGDAGAVDDVSCFGADSSFTGRIEECMKCYPCATCVCYSKAALAPGKHYRKGILRRMWASMRAKGSACVKPQFS